MSQPAVPSVPFSFIYRRILPFLIGHAAALLTLLITALILHFLEPYLAVKIILLIYLLPVMISAALWGLSPGILASLFAFLAFNYSYIQPLHTFEVHETQDLISLFIFLIVAVVISQLIGQAKEGARLARSREWEAMRMYELISVLAGLQDAQSVAYTLARHTFETFHCTYVSVGLGKSPKDGQPALFSFPQEISVDTKPDVTITLNTVGGDEGEINIGLSNAMLSDMEMRLLSAIANQGAMALERIRLTQSETKAHMLEESDRLKSSLLNSVSHELRSPLAAIKASVSSLRSGAIEWDEPTRAELLAMIEEETDHLNSLVGNLLDMSRIDSGALQLQMRWNAIPEIVNGVANKMRKQLQTHTLVIDFSESTPLVPSDYVLLEQVFTNLISNSIKYAPAHTEIRISGQQEGDCYRMEVSNQGPHVPEEHLARIFDKFYRVTAADRITGTGLGLSICKGIIEAHGGRIWAENHPGRFTFQLCLPLTLNGALPAYPKDIEDE